MNLIFITDSPAHAKDLSIAGVDTIMVDLEINGKVDRQGHLNTLISNHDFDAIGFVADALLGSSSSTLVRLNPLYSETKFEVDKAISLGASKLMLPMFSSPVEVVLFLSYVGGRVPVTLLLETSAALARLPEILKIDGDFDIHIGLNDLHLEMKLNFMFELLKKDGIVEYVANLCKKYKRSFGFGGVSRLGGDAHLAAEYILSEHVRLGSSSVFLSRDWRASLSEGDFINQVTSLREFLTSGISIDPLVVSDQVSRVVGTNIKS